jgi:hypothetical protein
MLKDILVVFTGLENPNGISGHGESTTGNRVIAVSQNGICVFIEGLVSMSPRANLLRRVHVMPGHIARATPRRPQAIPKIFDCVIDIPKWPAPTLECAQVVPAMRPGTPSLVSTDQSPLDETQHVSATVLPKMVMEGEVSEAGEAENAIIFYYRISAPTGEIIIPPGRITITILANTGIVGCDKSKCAAELFPDHTLLKVERGWAFPEHTLLKVERGWAFPEHTLLKVEGGWAFTQGRVILPLGEQGLCDWAHLQASDIGRLAAIGAVQHCVDDNKSIYDDKIVLRRRECLPCCSHALSQYKSRLEQHTVHLI